MHISKITSAAAGNEDFLAGPRGALDHSNTAAALAGFDGAQEAGGAGAENHSIVVTIHLPNPELR